MEQHNIKEITVYIKSVQNEHNRFFAHSNLSRRMLSLAKLLP